MTTTKKVLLDCLLIIC